MAQRSPGIAQLSWGRVTTDAGTFRDAKLWPGGGRNWDWTETGTEHEPGVQSADVTEVLDGGAEIVVIGRGQLERLQVTQAAIAAAEERGASCVVLASQEATERYNALAADGAAVGALIHSTC